MDNIEDEISFRLCMKLIALVLCVGIIAIATYNAYTTYLYVSGGYTVESLPGNSTPQYVLKK